jgi:D-sedoheptulose 7-phosphate isomerase
MTKNYLNKYLNKFNSLIDLDENSLKKLEVVSKIFKQTYNKNKVIIFGNGGSASIAGHFTVDLIKNTKLRSINFSDPAILTCFANDYGYENWVSQALKIYSDKNDVVVLISSSGMSKNMINAANYAKKNKLKIITFTGFNKSNTLSKKGDVNFWVNSKNYNHIENIHQLLLLSICDFIAKKKF